MIYCIDENIDEPIMLINTHIGFDEDEGMGIDGALFQKELLYLDTLGKKRIQIWINSIGGVVMDGYSIASAILKTNTPVDTFNVGICASIAGVIFMCGRNRVAMDYSLLMIHKPSGGNDEKVLDLMQESLVTMLTAKSQLTNEQVNTLMDATSWINADECLKMGFANEIEKTAKTETITATNYADIFTQANKITNKILKPIINTKKSMLKITNKLGLNAEASEESIVDAIDQMKNASAEELQALMLEMEQMETAMEALKEKYEAIVEQMDAEKGAREEEDAMEMISNFAKLGRIKNDDENVKMWVNLAKADLQGTKAIIENLPLNVVANKIENKIIDANAPTFEKGEDFMAFELKQINNKNKK
jgi:ATP-dependent protease ClpP protease subunit